RAYLCRLYLRLSDGEVGLCGEAIVNGLFLHHLLQDPLHANLLALLIDSIANYHSITILVDIGLPGGLRLLLCILCLLCCDDLGVWNLCLSILGCYIQCL